MSKAIQLFTSASGGASAQVAQSQAGLWFARRWEYNGYAKAWSSWCKVDAPTHPDRLLNPTDMVESYGIPEYRELDEQERARTILSAYGRMTMASAEVIAASRLRLPDSPEEIEAKEIAKACRTPKAKARQAARI